MNVRLQKNLLPPEAEKAAIVRAMFDRIAPRYDLLNRLFSFRLDQRWRRETLRTLALTPSDIVLDLACGTGDFSALAAQTGARVIGVDFAKNMLTSARQRRINAALVQADASALPFRAGQFSALVSGFALRNFVSIPAVLREAARIVAPGGRIAFLEVDTPSHPLLRWGHGVYFNRVVPVLGALFSDAWAYAYLPRSVAYLPEPAALRHMFEIAGFHTVTRRRLSGGIAQLLTAVR
ncbi:MAG TPA: ubiquinone/menaquinone biosynthesis methyltransferase [Methylomirabilota bacterium]|jgi:demethylmenaquinone methyltransferase/2-methoxy-6-polyprenyl-1,4-benzoquinol methylase|nr:ubiquinone/menaquinone biosynthesis methyltransferase [Methylomirabilota bacterium]